LIACEDPPEVENGETIIVRSPNRGFGYSVGMTIGFRCEDGFRLQGVAENTCKTDRTWSDSFPSCVPIACVPPLIEGNEAPVAVDARDVYSVGETLTFRCGDADGGTTYEMIGSNEITCNESGDWNGSIPACRLKICPPVELRHGVVTFSSANSSLASWQPTIGTELSFRCNDGYRLSGNASVVCTEARVWSTDIPKCLSSVCPVPVIPNGRTVVISDSGIDGSTEGEDIDHYPIGLKILIGCFTGYQLPAGAASLSVCNESAEWAPELPVQCDLVKCPHFTVDGGEIRVNGQQVANQSDVVYSYLDVVTVVCQTGHSLVGRSHISCESSGTWSDKPPACERIRCPDPKVPNGAVRVLGVPYGVTTAYTFGVIVFTNCDDGYTLEGSVENVCQEDGTWVEPFPVCVPVRCPALLIGNATHDGPEAPEFGVRVTVRCLVGFELFGDATLQCQANGRWSGVMPVCWRVACKLPSVPDARIIRASQTTAKRQPGSAGAPPVSVSFGDEVIVQCHDGFQMVGGTDNGNGSRLICGADKIWRPSVPTCRRRDCVDPLLRNITHLQINVQSPESTKNATVAAAATASEKYVFGTKLVFECDLGYRLTHGGPTSMTCKTSGEWTTSSSGDSGAAMGSTQRPACVPVFCPTPNITDGYLHRQSSDGTYSFGDSIRIRCRPGFSIQGESELFCQPNAEWTADMPRCIRKSCPDRPPTIENGYPAFGLPTPPFGRSMFEDVVVYRCNVGYEFDEHDNVTCTETGKWSENLPTCSPIRCPPPETVSHGTFMTNGYGYRSVLRYACLSGYQLIGGADHDCLANGTWSGKTPTCERVQCPHPPFVPHANLTRVNRNGDGEESTTTSPSSSHSFGDSLTVTCHRGYRLHGLAGVQCLENGTWSRVQAECRIVNCGQPPQVGLAEPTVLTLSSTGSGRDFNATIGFVCQSGYRLVGRETHSTCQADGTWTTIDAMCVRITCSTPPIPEHGSVAFDLLEARTPEDVAFFWPHGFHFRDRISVLCDDGYELPIGVSPVLTCGSNAQWNGSASVRCELVTCNRPLTVGYYAYRDRGGEPLRLFYPFGYALEVHCETGYRRSGRFGSAGSEGVAIVCQADRKWNVSGITCQKVVCPTPKPPEHGRVIAGADLDYGSRVEYQCMEGYKLIGDKHRRCGENGSWDQIRAGAPYQSLPYCVPMNCSEPEIPVNGFINTRDGHSFQSVTTYRCNEGYRLDGPTAIACLANGKWNDTSPRCRIVTCGQPVAVDNADVDVNGTTFGSTAVYRCRTGYEMAEGDRRLATRSHSCAASGTWTGPSARCRRVKCPKPIAPESGFVIGNDVEFDAVVLFSCRSGYALVGNASRRCQADGTWNGSSPVCRLKFCPTPEAPQHGHVIGLSPERQLPPGSSVEYECESGFRLNGSRLLMCRENETWSAPSPHCDRITCDRPPPVDNANVTSIGGGGSYATDRTPSASSSPSAYFFGDVVRYTCHRGFRLRGPEMVRCEVDGTWSERGRTWCDRVRCGDPPAVRYAKAVPSGVFAGDLVYYVCDDGYDLTGNNLLECSSSDARWTGNTPTCEPIKCGVVPVIPHATTIVHRTTFGSRATYECNRGFRLVGGSASAVVECKANRTWAYAERPACVPVDCGAPPQSTPATGSGVAYDTTTYNSTATYYCREGFQFASDGKKNNSSCPRVVADGDLRRDSCRDEQLCGYNN
jgi:hypothetical protein